jgi:TonB-dependent SusC/RagA subfamily outer membrane receptor
MLSFFLNLQVVKVNVMKARSIVVLLITLAVAGKAEGQQRMKPVTVTGAVTDTLMSPVSGALIVVDGVSTGIFTSRNGTFKMRIKPDVKSIGAFTSNMGSVVVAYDGGTRVDFVLDGREAMPGFEPEISEGEMEIDVAYGTVKRKNLTTGVGYIDGQDEVYASYTNIYDMIQGRVPGVSVSGNKITIRGINSINSGTDPLLLVDGIVVNSIDNISPRQVKSISVLKGSDASIYGSRGANGVILITLIGTQR